MSTLIVENLKGPTTGANANKIIVPSGQTLQAAGHVIQVKDVTTTTKTRVDTAAWHAAGGLSLNITPKFATSKILVSYFLSVRTYRSGSHDSQSRFGISRDGGTTILMPTQTRSYDYGGSGIIVNNGLAKSFLDSPNTTSQITYQVYFYHATGSNTEINTYGNNNPPSDESSIVLMEIAQ